MTLYSQRNIHGKRVSVCERERDRRRMHGLQAMKIAYRRIRNNDVEIVKLDRIV